MTEEERDKMMRSNWEMQMAAFGYGPDGLALPKEDVTPAGRAGQCPAPTDEAFGRWISVNDRLPEQHEEDPEDPQDPDARYTVSDPVLVYDGKHITAGVFCEGIWDLDAAYTEPGTVTHWMPLPEPPKEAEHGNS